MTTRNPRMRLMANSYLDAATVTASSALAAYPLTNLLLPNRAKTFRFAGNFTVTASNKTLYINDGADKTVTLTEGSYTYSTLATHVAARLNLSSSAWTCTYDFSGGTFKYTIGHTGSATLRFSQTTDAAWDLLGYTGVANVTATSWVAEEQRNHSEEWIAWDLLTARSQDFFALIPTLSRSLGLSATATLKLQLNTTATWTAPALDLDLTAHDLGLMRFQDDEADRTYRYGRVKIVDRLNTCGPEGFDFAHCYLGDYDTFTDTNLSRGFSLQHVDPSDQVESFGGVPYFNLKPMFRVFSDMGVGFVPAADRALMRELYRDVGRHTPFYASLDPLVSISEDLQEMTAYVRFAGDPTFKHTHASYFAWSLALKEVV